MASTTDKSNEIEVTNSKTNTDEVKTKLPLKIRIKNSFTKFIESTSVFIYDKNKKRMFGGSSSFWMKISAYYFIFYVCLGLFFSGMIAIFGAITSRQTPTYTYNHSSLSIQGITPVGMGFRPMSDITDVSITVYNDTVSQYATTSSLTIYRVAFLTQYNQANLEDCSPSQSAGQLPAGQSCRFSWSDIVTSETHPCSDGNLYGWSAGQPCILIKLNKIYGWQPAAGSVIAQVENATGQPVLSVDQRQDNIYITCNGKEQADIEMLGNMTYYSLLHPLGNPNYGGIPYYFYPYLNSNDHVEPFVLVQFTSLPLYYLVNIQCSAWAPNIQQLSAGTTVRGMVTFNLYRSDQASPKKS